MGMCVANLSLESSQHPSGLCAKGDQGRRLSEDPRNLLDPEFDAIYISVLELTRVLGNFAQDTVKSPFILCFSLLNTFRCSNYAESPLTD